jgi:putative membrane protein (TIGR04086 family)
MKIKPLASKNTRNSSVKIEPLNIIKGVILAYIVSLLLFLITGGLIHFTEIPESVIPTAVTGISALSIILAGVYVAKRTDFRGWLNGGIVGFLYVLVISVLSMFLLPDFSFSLMSVGRLLIGFVVGALGGILGVNL